MVKTGSKEIRVAIFSDTHGNKKAMREAMLNQGPFDAMIHLGDGVSDGEAVSREMGAPFLGVAGNEDFGTGLPEKRVLSINQWSFLLLHGHQTEINPFQPKQIWDEHIRHMCHLAQEEDAGVLFFGHTHQTLLEINHGVILCNPGNQHLGSSQPPTFVIMEITRDTLDIRVMKRAGAQGWRPDLSSVFKAG
ncbi:MAG: YfcE family phosphodiesterase [Thermodesulfobacteriota bacterium]|nr:YfcE family phosphodiesterase [Thermodesulfobacteriota bacterium]